jgi:hypothetical protein
VGHKCIGPTGTFGDQFAFFCFRTLFCRLQRLTLLKSLFPEHLRRLLVYGVDRASDCQSKTAALQAEIVTFTRDYPADWTIDVMSTDVVWEELYRMADQTRTFAAFSVL